MEKLIIFNDTLLSTNRSFDFYVDWSKLDNLLDDYLIEISCLNALINIEEQLYDENLYTIIQKFPSSINIFLYLIAISNSEKNRYMRGNSNLNIINSSKLVSGYLNSNMDNVKEYRFNFTRNDILSDKEIKKYIDFTKKSGIKLLFTKYLDENLHDYIKGCEVGLDTNARKNRGGLAFEIAIEPIILEISNKYNIKMITQKNLAVLEDYGFNISNDIKKRRADFILVKDNKAMNIEVNFFSSSGSKPEEIIDAYITRQDNLKNCNIGFAMLTDGLAWKQEQISNNTFNQIKKGFDNIDCILNYNMSKTGFLEDYITKYFEIL